MLRGIWDSMKLTKRNYSIQFNSPASYDIYNSQRLLKVKFENYALIAGTEGLSKEQAMMDYLGMTKAEIILNNEMVFNEQKQVAFNSWVVGAISSTGKEPRLEASE